MGRKRASFRSRDIGGPPKDQTWWWYTVEMMRSDAWRDMSVNARRMLDLLEIEHLSHGGYENSNLIMTYDQFVAGGIRRGSGAENGTGAVPEPTLSSRSERRLTKQR